jgi:hypothetical protein
MTKSKAAETKTEPKAVKKQEPVVGYTRVQAIAETMKAGTTEIEKILADADKLYAKKTGRAANEKETKANWNFVRSTLLAFGYGAEKDGVFLLAGKAK